MTRSRILLALSVLVSVHSAALAAPNAYVLEYNGRVAIVDTAPNTLTTNSLQVGAAAWSVAIRPGRVYFYNSSPAQITVVNTSNDTLITQVPVPCANDSWIAISPDGAHVYIGCNPTGNLLVYDTSTDSVTATLPIAGALLRDLVTNPIGDRLFIADTGNALVQVVDTTSPAAPLLLAPIPVVPFAANGIAFSASENRLYVPRAADLASIDVATNAVTSIPALGLHASANLAGSRVYLANPPGTVTAIDSATDTILGTFDAGAGLYSTGVHPVNGRIYALNQAQNNIQVFEADAPVFTPVATIAITNPPGFIEPRINGRFIGPAPAIVEVPALSLPGTVALWTMLVIAGMIAIGRRRAP